MPRPHDDPALPHPVRIGAAFWVQRTDWPSLRVALETAEAGGADDLWIDDHLLADEGDSADGKLEGWTTLAAAAAVTTRARLGLLVAANTFRNPGLTAKLATTLDHISGGRAILGLGGGWFEEEHTSFGIDFGTGFGERLDRLAESVEVIRRLLDGARFSHEGRFYTMRDALCAPRPVQAHLPILIGGSGPQKTLRIVARHANLWNAYGSPESLAATDAILRERCAEVGRDQATIERTVNLNVVVRSTRADAERVWESYAAAHRPREGEGRLVVGGPVEEVANALAEYAAVGFRHPILIFRSPWDLETISSLGAIRAALAQASTEGRMSDSSAAPTIAARGGDPALSVHGLSKRFGDRVAFDDVSFDVARGEVFGFLGPNGAGKTTTVRTLGTLIAPTTGTAIVAGIPLTPANGVEIRKRIAIMPEAPGLYLRLSVIENLECFADLYEVSNPSGRIGQALEAVNIGDRAHDLCGTLSKGLRQRVALARALLSDPEVLFLDEPTSGLDPVAAREVHELIDGLRKRGVTIFLTTHRLEEAERLCDRVAILNTTLRTIGRPVELRDRLFARTLTIRTLAALPDPDRVFGGVPAVDGWRQDGPTGYVITVSEPSIAAPAVTRALVAGGADVLSIAESHHSLEDVYLELIDEDPEARPR